MLTYSTVHPTSLIDMYSNIFLQNIFIFQHFPSKEYNVTFQNKVPKEVEALIYCTYR